MCAQRGFPHSSPVQSVCHWATHSLTHPTHLSLGTAPLALPLHLLVSFLPCFWLSLFLSFGSVCIFLPCLSLSRLSYNSTFHPSLHLHFISQLSFLSSLCLNLVSLCLHVLLLTNEGCSVLWNNFIIRKPAFEELRITGLFWIWWLNIFEILVCLLNRNKPGSRPPKAHRSQIFFNNRSDVLLTAGCFPSWEKNRANQRLGGIRKDDAFFLCQRQKNCHRIIAIKMGTSIDNIHTTIQVV